MSGFSHIVIGAGRMGTAMVAGWTGGTNPVVSANNVLLIDPYLTPAAAQLVEKGCVHRTELTESIDTAEYVLLAIKPQMFDRLARDIARALPPGCVVISILAGTPLTRLQETFPAQNVVRAMPNTPAAIGKGITAFTCEPQVTSEQKTVITSLLSAGGKVAEVGSDQAIDMVTAVSGSGPAYFFYMVEALEAAAIKVGLPADIAPEFARQTLIGAGALIEQSDASARELREAVTSPGGTTQAALDVLMSDTGLPPLVRDAVQAAFRRAKELGKG